MFIIHCSILFKAPLSRFYLEKRPYIIFSNTKKIINNITAHYFSHNKNISCKNKILKIGYILMTIIVFLILMHNFIYIIIKIILYYNNL